MQVKCRYTLILSLVEQVLTYSNNFIMLRNHYTLSSSIFNVTIMYSAVFLITQFLCVLAIIIDHPTYIASQHRGRTKPLYDGNVKILNDGFFTNIKSRAYTVTKTDIDVWESKNGRIPNGALVILRTGWSQYFHQPDNFFGNFADEDKQVFPGKCSKIV